MNTLVKTLGSVVTLDDLLLSAHILIVWVLKGKRVRRKKGGAHERYAYVSRRKRRRYGIVPQIYRLGLILYEYVTTPPGLNRLNQVGLVSKAVVPERQELHCASREMHGQCLAVLWHGSTG